MTTMADAFTVDSDADDQARAEGRRFLDEDRDRDVIEGWYAEAERMTLVVLPAFLEGLTKAYRHDYGTICHAIAAAAVAAANAVNHASDGGITGFQAGAVMWQFIERWMGDYRGKPLRLIDYSWLLYPQYEERFAPTISAATWEWVQKEAERLLADPTTNPAHPDVIEHWRRIVAGEVPFGLTVAEA